MKFLIIISLVILIPCILFILYVLFTEIYSKYISRRNFIILKKNITSLNKNVKELKNIIVDLPCALLSSYNESVSNKITDDIVTIEYYRKLQCVYDSLIEYKKIINSINNSILLISNSKSDILNYIQYNYPYCENYIKEELNKFLTEINIDNSKDYTKSRMHRLINEQKILDNKLNMFLNKIVKINNIITDYKNINIKISELNNLNLLWLKNKKKLESIKVGNRYNSLIKPDFNYYVDNMKNNLELSLKYLNDEDLNNSLLCYGYCSTSVSLLTKTYDSMSKLLLDYNNSNKYIKLNSKCIINIRTKIDDIIFKLGVKNSNRILYDEYKNDILIYKNLLNFDKISASEKHKDIVKNLEKLLINIEIEIALYYKNKKM